MTLAILLTFTIRHEEIPPLDPSLSAHTSEDLSNSRASSKVTDTSEITQINANSSAFHTLYGDIRLVGVSYNSAPNRRIALLEHNSKQYQYRLDDYLFGTSAQVIDIDKQSILIAFNNEYYRLDLHRGTLASKTSQTLSTSSNNKNSDVASIAAIGNRPKKLSHIINVPESYHPGDKLYADYGLNPNLFKNAGFKAGDELLTVNGLDVSLADLFDDIQHKISTEHTLKFEVLRDGKKIVLFLDIPSETLKFQ